MSCFDALNCLENGMNSILNQQIKVLLTRFSTQLLEGYEMEINVDEEANKFIQTDPDIVNMKKKIREYVPPQSIAPVAGSIVHAGTQAVKRRSPTVVTEMTCCGSVKSKGGCRCTAKGKFSVIGQQGLWVCGRHVDKTTVDGDTGSVKNDEIHSSAYGGAIAPSLSAPSRSIIPKQIMTVPTILPGMETPLAGASDTGSVGQQTPQQSLMQPTLAPPDITKMSLFGGFPQLKSE